MSKHIIVVDNAEAALLELSNIVLKLREHTIYWENNYGSLAKQNKKYAEKKADEWLLKHTKKLKEWEDG